MMFIRIGNGLMRPCDITKELLVTKNIEHAVYLGDCWETIKKIKQIWGITATAVPTYEADRLCEQQ